MKKKAQLRIILFIVIAYLIIFGIFSLSAKNYEFLYYTGIMSIIIFVAVLYHKKLHLPVPVLAGFAVFGIMHVSGGNIWIGTTRLYDLWLIPGILKYDNLVHFVAIFFVTLAIYSLLYPHFDKKIKRNKFLLFLLLILISLGIGAFHEILELIAVALFHVEERVGGYINNALDLVFNLIGAILACFFLLIYHRREEKKFLGII
jgi:hypothetical protein